MKIALLEDRKSEIDFEGIRMVQELEDALNAESQRAQIERAEAALERGDIQGYYQALKDKPHKYHFNAWKFK